MVRERVILFRFLHEVINWRNPYTKKGVSRSMKKVRSDDGGRNIAMVHA